MFISLPNAVLHAIQRLNAAGFEAYTVGGCVRDSLMGKSPEDWDITTSATPSEMQAVFGEYRCIETGLKHGTLTVIIENIPLEITTYRVDGDYSDGRHPDSVMFTRTLAEDLQRRDFTVNAMAYHPSVGLIDLYGGQLDIQNRTIRCVGESGRRFSEDALRILRALRFASTLGFSLDTETANALRQLSPTLSCVATERIATELQKLLCGQDAHRVVSQYRDVLNEILPEIAHSSEIHLLSHAPATPHARFAALFLLSNCSVDTAEKALHRLRMDNHTIDRVRRLLLCCDWPMATDLNLLQLLNCLDRELIFDYLAIRNADGAIIQQVKHLLGTNACYKVSMLAINGNDVIAAGVSMGPDVGSALHTLLDAVMQGVCPNQKEALLQYISERKKPAP